MKTLMIGKVLSRFIFCCSMICSSFTLAETRPNVLIIYVDDLGYGDTGVYGHSHVRTPNIDKLASEGVRFTQFYAPSALCSPSRAGLLTGRTPYRTGVESWIPDGSKISLGRNEVTIANLLKDRGYRTAVIGKWHLNGGLDMEDTPQPKDFGFDYQYGLAAWVKNSSVEKSRTGPLYPDNMYRNYKPVGQTYKFSAELVSDEAIKWISEDDEPFFLFLTYSEVHTPIASPVEYTRLYDQFLTEESRGDPWLYYFDWANHAPRGKGEYYANITFLDAQLGRVLELLKREEKLDNTLIIFSSDNGPVTAEASEPWELSMAGETGGLRGKKRYLYEGGLRVPAIIRFPGFARPNTILNTPVTALDLMPTIAEITGATMPDDRPIDGRSLVDLIKNGTFDRARPLYWSIPTPDGMEYAIRDGDWKLILDESAAPRFLFNLAEDFYEIYNQLNSLPDKVAELEKKFKHYRRDVDSDPIRRAREI